MVDKEVADQALAEPQEDNVHPLVERLMERNMLVCIMSPQLIQSMYAMALSLCSNELLEGLRVLNRT